MRMKSKIAAAAAALALLGGAGATLARVPRPRPTIVIGYVIDVDTDTNSFTFHQGLKKHGKEYPVTTSETTAFYKHRMPATFGDVAVDDAVQVVGTRQPDGSVAAKQVVVLEITGP